MGERTVKTCRFCGADVQYARVFVGTRARRKVVVLTIDAHPHPDGRVILRRDDNYQLLLPDRRIHEGRATFRVHSRNECQPARV